MNGLKTSCTAVETVCMGVLRRMGYRIQNLGWPDFLGMSDDGEIIAVEAKDSSLTVLLAPQKLALLCLARYGIPCFRWSPDEGLQQVTESTLSDDDDWVRKRVQFWPKDDTQLPEDGTSEKPGTSLKSGLGSARRWDVKVRAIHLAAEKPFILDALKKTGGNRVKAAELLGMSYRTILYKLKEIREAEAAEGASS